jgi:8-oxo-dGTP pyrophosphatase MutT (NUDIX family)
LQISKKKLKNKKINYLLLMIKKKIGAGILAIDKKDGTILLGRRGMNGSFPNCWATFGGTFEESDGTPKQTAKREFFEETNVNTNYKLSKEPFFMNTNPFIDFYTYIGLFDGKPNVIINDESLDYGWFKINEIPKNLHPGVKELFDKKYYVLESLINDLINK